MPGVILLEFNELSPVLMDRFMAERRLPNFRRLHDEAHVYITTAAEQPPFLEPWIQWVNVHSGLNYEDHKIFQLDEGQNLTVPCVWDVLCKEGYRVGICGSMNVRYEPPLNGYVLPDPWSTLVEPYPASLKSYFNFVQKNVMEHTNERVPVSKAEYLQFAGFMAKNGLSGDTVTATIRQLLSERAGHTRWKRATILDRLQFDVFRHYYRKFKPHFSTFFLNSTAHFQHMYWRNMEPEHFKVKPTAAEQSVFESAVLFGYQEMDKLVGRFLQLCQPNTTLILCTALSQQACLKYEDQGGKCFHRPKNFEQLLEFAGVTAAHHTSAVMSEEFHIYFEAERDAIEAEALLRELRVEDEVVLGIRCENTVLFGGCSIFHPVARNARLTAPSSGRFAPFLDIFYQAEGIKSGMHHPDGILWIRYPNHTHRVHAGKVPLTSIAPTILDLFTVRLPAHMRGPSLLSGAYKAQLV
jgi:hypothetical protein